MQRKDVQVGRIYHSGRTVIKVLDTSESPVAAEQYDFVNQTWHPVKVMPRDIDALVSAEDVTARELLEYSETVNAAARRRFLHGVVKAVNEKHGVHAMIASDDVSFLRRLTVKSEDATNVVITTRDWALLTEAGIEPPTGTVTVRAWDFASWALGLGIEAPVTADIQPYPGVNPADLDADLLREAKELLDTLTDQYNRARNIQTEVQRAAAAAEQAKAAARGERKYVSAHTMRDVPTVKAEVRKQLAAAGLTEAALDTSIGTIDAMTLVDLGLR